MGHPDSEKVVSQGTSAYNIVVTHDTVSAMGLSQPPANTPSLVKTYSDETIAAHRVSTLRIGPELGSHPVVGGASRWDFIRATLRLVPQSLVGVVM